jgi:hypothetical protein
MMGDMRSEREQAAYQFQIQAGRLGYGVLKRLSPYTYLVKDVDDYKGTISTAIVLPVSFDFYTYRMQKSAAFDVLIVQRHNAIVPVNVIDMKTSMKYFPGDRIDAVMREHAKRRNADEKALLLSQIITGTKDGQRLLHDMSPRMRQRYLKEAQGYLRGRVGRPFGRS